MKGLLRAQFLEANMNGIVGDDIAAKIQNLYEQDVTAAALFDWLSERERNSPETTALRAAKKTDCEYSEIVRIFRELEEFGCGRFISGRKGFHTRIRWEYKIIELAKIARGQEGSVIRVDPADWDDDWEEDDSVLHEFQLRPDLKVSISLPKDLSKKEAERVSAFVLTLPFD